MSRRLAAVSALVLAAACSSNVAAPDPLRVESTRGAAPVFAATQHAPRAEVAHGFAGSWRSTYGALRIRVEGSRASGRYVYGPGGTVEGVVDGRTLRVAYTEPGGVAGRARFVLADDGASFRGTWKEGAREDAELDAPGATDWNGERVVPVPGRTWLVVLEVYWRSRRTAGTAIRSATGSCARPARSRVSSRAARVPRTWHIPASATQG